MLGYLLSRLLVITCGLLYPAFCSYKAIKEKNARGYIRWMTYWIVFALFTTAEVIIEPLLAFWFPFYYELKICLILTLVSSGGTQFAYRRLIHPRLVQHEEMIDAFLRDFKSKVTDYLYRWGSQLLASASDNIWRAALRARLHMGDRSVDQDYTNQLTGQRDVADGQGALTRSYSYQREKLDEILRNGNDGMWSEDDFPRASPTSTQRPQPNESGPRTRSKKGMPKKRAARVTPTGVPSNISSSEESPDTAMDEAINLTRPRTRAARQARTTRRNEKDVISTHQSLANVWKEMLEVE